MTFPFARSQEHATRFIKRWGGPLRGYLVRNGVKRAAWMARRSFDPKERDLVVDGMMRFYVEGGIAVAPDHELDHIEYRGKTYRIISPVSGPRPGDVVIYYDCTVVQFTEGA